MKTNQFTNSLIILVASAIMFSVYSCSTDKSPKEPPSFAITIPDVGEAPSTITLSSEESNLSLDITSNSTWKIIKKGDKIDWVTVTPMEGEKNGKINIIVSKNSSITEREISLSFLVADKEDFKKLKIVQKAYVPSLVVSKEDSDLISFKGGEISFTIDSNNDKWEYNFTNNPAWIKEKEKTSTSLVLTVDKNSDEERTTSITFKLTDYPSVTKEFEIVQDAQPLPFLSVSPQKIIVGYKENEIILNIDSNDEWEYVIVDNPGWIIEKEKTSTNLTFKVSENTTGKERTANITFSLTFITGSTQEITITQNNNVLAADLLDVVFKEDGTAKDISPSNRKIETIDNEETLKTLYSEKYKRYIARFDNPPMENISTGFYMVDYAEDQQFRDHLSDGYTLEALFMNDLELTGRPASNEFSILSSLQGGGTQLGIANYGGSFFIRFLASINTSNWGWVHTSSGINPVKGTYFHVVGIWDKEEAKTYVYVNGELKGSLQTVGHYVHPWESSGNQYASNWFGIGVDANKDRGETPLTGEIVIARIYSKALKAEEVQELWNRVEKY